MSQLKAQLEANHNSVSGPQPVDKDKWKSRLFGFMKKWNSSSTKESGSTYNVEDTADKLTEDFKDISISKNSLSETHLVSWSPETKSPAATLEEVVQGPREYEGKFRKNLLPEDFTTPEELVVSPATKRKSVACQVYFLEYYSEKLSYMQRRQNRYAEYKKSVEDPKLTISEREEKWNQYRTKESIFLRKRRTRTNANQFHLLTQVGQGGYGQVYLARKKDTDEICALKKMNKKHLAKNNEIQHILNERDVLTAANSPWLVQLFYAFQDLDHVYLAMEYVPGGDLRSLLNSSGSVAEVHSRFYIAEMLLAVNALHRLGYIHRDLKPENFLIDGSGHLKLTDFGLSTGSLNPTKIKTLKNKLDEATSHQVVYRSSIERRSIHRSIRQNHLEWAYSLVGSADYLAPEILVNKGYDFLVDFWSIGCIAYEFLAGYPPFAGSSMQEVWSNVYHWEKVLERPELEGGESISDEAWDMICMFITDRKKRVSSMSKIQNHPFFKDLEWGTVRDTAAPPFIPQLDSEVDASYFDDFNSPENLALYKEVFDKQEALEKATEAKDPIPRSAFVGFTFQRKDRRAWTELQTQIQPQAQPANCSSTEKSQLTMI
ncbi:kinase-like protein [Basidiobolus meristosporus CBS 931.73]|uniref:non-specific serine/threonine protein kinase n=1 Tax=Basidiobolus meristosporus CBS 931.73 TaxID=1314790 RepID=A0A1Y1VRH7_9FUNG|nr:kinase-like protein [Basidiobolus meristosporus CBS 931.73]ORY04616.1 kinase-like protein [Basidiobolus meristosporus CBS 931.73]|eukprot:ORX63888.1 kinase-like protein [Basidiobolus meristosporus CBS 931.73]